MQKAELVTVGSGAGLRQKLDLSPAKGMRRE